MEKYCQKESIILIEPHFIFEKLPTTVFVAFQTLVPLYYPFSPVSGVTENGKTVMIIQLQWMGLKERGAGTHKGLFLSSFVSKNCQWAHFFWYAEHFPLKQSAKVTGKPTRKHNLEPLLLF